MKKPLLNYVRSGFLIGLFIAAAVANALNLNMLWSCAAGAFAGAGIGTVSGLIIRAKK